MLDERLKNISRQELSDAVRKRQLDVIIKKKQAQQTKQKWMFLSTCLVFAIVLFVFIQTLDSKSPPFIEQSASELSIEELEKATSLFSKRPERMYNLASPFYVDKLIMKDENMLQELQKIMQRIELKPFEGDLNQYTSTTNYLLEQKDGKELYLKWLYIGDQIRVIQTDTMMELVLSEDSLIELEKLWMILYTEQSELSTWDIIVLIIIGAILIGDAINRKKSQQEKKNMTFLTFLVGVVMISLFYLASNWLGTVHLLLFLCISTFSGFLDEGLQLRLKKKEVNWFLFIKELTLFNLIIILIFTLG